MWIAFPSAETEGRGHYVGVILNILQNQGDWWGEGDEMMFIDDKTKPHLNGTGSEDYFLGGWCYGNPINGGDMRGSRWFDRYFKATSSSAGPHPANDQY